MSTPQSNKWRGPLIEAGVAIVMILLAFIAIAASDVSASGSFHYWLGLIGLYALISLVSQHYFQYKTLAHTSNALALLLHWAGVLAAVLMIFFFVSTGRITNADTGLTNGVILALGTFTAGVRGNWRLMVVGVTLAAATVSVAVVEEYLWILFALVLLAMAVLLVGTRWSRARALARHTA